MSVASLEEEIQGLLQPRPRGRILLGIQDNKAEHVRRVRSAEGVAYAPGQLQALLEVTLARLVVALRVCHDASHRRVDRA